MLEPVVERTGVRLLDVELITGSNGPILRVTIYKPEGVSLDDCVAVNNLVEPILDETDPIPGSYNLEVSSPGLERTLKRDKEFTIFKGRDCRVNFFAPLNGVRSIEGVFTGLDDSGKVILELPDGVVAFNRNNISKVQLVYREKKGGGKN